MFAFTAFCPSSDLKQAEFYFKGKFTNNQAMEPLVSRSLRQSVRRLR